MCKVTLSCSKCGRMLPWIMRGLHPSLYCKCAWAGKIIKRK